VRGPTEFDRYFDQSRITLNQKKRKVNFLGPLQPDRWPCGAAVGLLTEQAEIVDRHRWSLMNRRYLQPRPDCSPR